MTGRSGWAAAGARAESGNGDVDLARRHRGCVMVGDIGGDVGLLGARGGGTVQTGDVPRCENTACRQGCTAAMSILRGGRCGGWRAAGGLGGWEAPLQLRRAEQCHPRLW